ncbi:MAG: transporter, ATP-binding protein [Acidimicrobiales bacterium]|nr:transporter, ATP-binding protein [Acidimicrobiales bacterium]
MTGTTNDGPETVDQHATPGDGLAAPAPTAAPTAETASSFRFARRILRADPRTWLISVSLWVLFFTLPLASGLVLRAVLDKLPPGDGVGIWGVVAVLAGFEIGRWLLLLPAIVQWHGAFVYWHTVPRINVMRSLGRDPGPVTGRLPGSPGEAVSRFRDDARDIALVLDVWLDLVAATFGAVGGLLVLLAISPPAAAAMLVPVIVVLWIGQLLAARLRRWRWDERQATARITGFIGDAFGAIGAVKVSAAEPAVLRRFQSLGHERAAAARRDQVGTQLSQVLGGITANAGLGLALVLAAPAMRRGDLTIGDIGLFTTYATVVAGLPRITARWAAWQRQGDVSAARLGRLIADHDPDQASQAVETHLRHGPPAYRADPVVARADRSAGVRLEHLRVRNLHVHLDDTDQVCGVDLDVTRGQLVVITGPVGSGKSVLLRALLGLVPHAQGTITWNGTAVPDPSTVLVPPRVAYVPQVPRLFSEPLAETVLLGVDGRGLDRALVLACLDDDLVDMPDGHQTMVGARGVRLSGGQVQRAAAARAFVREPELLVIDDLSSALDVATESRLWDGLFADADEGLTVLAVSHRPRVLARADQVIHLDAGLGRRSS